MNEDLAQSESSSNITADELDEETVKKLRGDAIGNTMYSEVFVLNTLLQFSDLRWSEEVENQLCFLWDMTEEKDVCEYLFDASYTSLACSAIQNYNEPRFIEIVVGIFANLLCFDSHKIIETAEIKVVLNLLNTDDPYILIQIMRFLHALCSRFEKIDFIESEHLAKFDFILNNSTNKELLIITLKALAALTRDRKIKPSVLQGELLLSSITAHRSLKDDSESFNGNFESERIHTDLRYLIEFLSNMCTYIDILEVTSFESTLKSHIIEFNKEVVTLLDYYGDEDVCISSDDNFGFYMEALAYIYRVLSVPYTSVIARPIFKIFCTLHSKESTNIQIVLEIVCYFISVGNPKEVINDFPNKNIKEIISFIKERNEVFDFNYVDCINRILEQL